MKCIRLLKGLYIHPLTVALFTAAYFSGFFYELSMAFLTAASHEAAHLLAALSLGSRCLAVSVMPYGMKLCIHPSKKIKNELLICLAGPFFNLFMLILFREGPLFEMNLSMLILNLFPVLPTDGGRVLYLLFSYKNPFSALGAMHKISFFSACIIIALGAYQAYSTGFNFSLFIIGAFLLASAFDKTERVRLYASAATAPISVPDEPIVEKCFAVSQKTPARRLLPLLSPYYFSGFDVIAPNGESVIRLSENDIIRAVRENGASVCISQIRPKG